MQIKATMKYRFTPTGIATIKNNKENMKPRHGQGHALRKLYPADLEATEAATT